MQAVRWKDSGSTGGGDGGRRIQVEKRADEVEEVTARSSDAHKRTFGFLLLCKLTRNIVSLQVRLSQYQRGREN